MKNPHIEREQPEQTKNEKSDVSRREFLKIGGTLAAGLQVGAVAGAGLAAGKDPATHTGWQHLGSNTQFVNRKPLEIDGLPYEKIGQQRRSEEEESVFGRERLLMQSMMSRGRERANSPQGPDKEKAERRRKKPAEAIGDLPPESQSRQRSPGPRQRSFPSLDQFSDPLAQFYKEHPDIYDLDKLRMDSIMPKKMKDVAKYGNYYTLIDAWSACWSESDPIRKPPEISDFQFGNSMMGRAKLRDPVPFKSPALASKLIKKVTHQFGATMVGITKLNPDWCYNYALRGSKDKGPYEVPKHWEYVIAFGVPHQWEQVNSNPNCGSSFDAYSRATIAARRLENFIKSLGYPARRHSPMDGYDFIGVPILVDAGLGQLGRHGIVITPETGSNFRAAFVTTNLPLEIDKPIDFGVNEFCSQCKICAEICPSSSISFEPDNKDMTTRGYRHWEINQTSCFNFWIRSMGGIGCRLCLIACPYSRKNNWAHSLARSADTKDPTGLLDNGLTWFQKTFFKYPEPVEYLPPPDGRFATFREPPEWLTTENYMDIEILDPTKGE